jgi:hypothetical protein
MEEKILLGQNSQIHEAPAAMWKQHLAVLPQHSHTRLGFMTDLHHRIRYFVVRELVNRQKPLEAEFISETLHIELKQVKDILEELERKLFFLVRNEQGAVVWAYPVTVEPTPHLLNFNTGKKLYAA